MTSDSKPDQLSGRQGWFANPRTDADGDIRYGAHLAALQARIAAESTAAEPAGVARPEAAPSPGKTGQWDPLGPAGVGHGQADGRPRVSGRVTSIAAHPGGQRAYIGTANGGTWYTDDAGVHWRCLDTYAETAPLTGRALGQSDALSVGAIAVAWGTDASTDVVYVGTGEGNRDWDTFFGIGIRVATGPAAADPLNPMAPSWNPEATKLANRAIYQLVLEPDQAARPGVGYAATNVGLWRRTVDSHGQPAWDLVFDPAAPSSGCTWLDFLNSPPAQEDSSLHVTDVAIAPAAGASPQTIYAAVEDTRHGREQQVWASASGDSGTWQPVPGYTATGRIALAVAPSDPSVVYALSRGKEPAPGAGVAAVPTKVARLVNGTFQPVTDVPTNLAGVAGHSQVYYDTVISVDPADPNVIWLGGSSQKNPLTGIHNASLFRGAVTAGQGAAAGTWSFGFLQANVNTPANDPSWVGAGAHADVHSLVFSGPAATPTVWLGCDGGVFQCQVVTPPPPNARGVVNNAAPGPWQALNNGLAITQPNYLAQTKVSDFLMLAGTQDNGVEERADSAVWTVAVVGDGGGCAIDDAHPSRRFVQYHRFSWYTVGAPGRAYKQTLDYDQNGAKQQPLLDAWQTEDKYSAFYSQAAARPLSGDSTALAFGSHRVWYCEDWALTWVRGNPQPATWRTLPTGTNPFEKKDNAGHPAPDQMQDSLHSQVVRVTFADDDNLLVLAQAWPRDRTPRPSPRKAGLYLLTRAGPPWNLTWLSPPDPGKPAPPDPPAGASSSFPADEIPLGLAVDQPGPPLTCYVTLGVGQKKENPGIDHVWWYDGAHAQWWRCGFDATVADTPVNAVVVDADRTVYVGTDVGVWKGSPDTAGAEKKWTWTQLSNGLPEAPVLDLVLSQSPHLLRAATHGRGVWELNLDETAPVTQTYLRAHVADTRRVIPAAPVDSGSLFGPPSSRIDASPDVVITGPANPAPPADLPLFMPPRPKRSDSVRVLQYALRRRQTAQPAVPPQLAPSPTMPLVSVDGSFGGKTKKVVKAFQANTPGLTATGKVQAQDWQAIVTAPYIDALAGADATYLDMALLDRISPVNGPPDGPSLAALPVNAEVYVQVNARGWQRRPVGSVNVGLLATPSFDATLATLPALPADWVKQFTDAITTPPATWLTGSTSWAWAGSPATMATTRPLHPEEPQVVRFTVTFPKPPGKASLPVQWTLLAFAWDPLDPLNPLDPLGATMTSVHDLVLNDRHAAVRSVTLFT